MNKIYGLFFCTCLALVQTPFCNAWTGQLQKAVDLYEGGLYSSAMTMLQAMPEYGSDAVVDGYAVLCAQKQRTPGYRTMADNYMKRYPTGILAGDVRLERAFDHFDTGEYEAALGDLSLLDPTKYPDPLKAEYCFKKGYCHYKAGNTQDALREYGKIGHLSFTDYTAPAQFCTGYINYTGGEFQKALDWFGKSSADERFRDISEYYTVNCNYELENYDYVLTKGVEMFESNVPVDRKAHLARIISESYLVKGDKANAKKYYSVSDDGGAKSRGDYFYAGCLLYATGDWQGAIDNYSAMPEKTDSLGQIAFYNTAFSYIQQKNKVAALDAFRQASKLDFDGKMTEDAMFNYAKLSFDLNGDTSVFADYMKKYSDRVRGEKIYSYMALAALSDRDYQSAINAYDNIDVLSGQDRLNYVHANYLRGAELLDNGSYRRAVQCMKAVTYYTPKNDRVNQLARYSLGEAYYRNEQYVDAAEQFRELYNNQALYGMVQGELLPYNVAYAFFKRKNYDSAAKWFDTYCSDGGKTVLEDALTRKADCLFAQNKYEQAAQAYQEVLDKYFDVNDIYPYYQCAVACGLSNRIDRKIELLENVTKADSTAAYYPDALFEYGRALQDKKQTRAALAVFEQVVSRVPGSVFAAKALLETGTVKRSLKDIDGALDAYKTVVEKLPESGYYDDALLAIESIYQSQNNPGLYLAYLEQIGKGATKSEEDKQNMIFSAAEQDFYSGNYARTLSSLQSFRQNFPSSAYIPKAEFLMSECYRYLGDKVHACDGYKSVIDRGQGEHYEEALKMYAELNFSLDNFNVAFDAYKTLSSVAKLPAQISFAKVGMVRSAFKDKNYENALDAAGLVLADGYVSSAEQREARLIKAKSLLNLSRRDEAFECLASLVSEPKTAEGAEASYMVIQDCFDKADFKAVEDKVYAFGGSGSGQQYWLAKSFIVLGDSYMEQQKYKQARATFQSIADAYSAKDEIPDQVKLRLDKLNEMNQ
ncbi:MAG: tetratricopeptide repeat protein [Bacteroidales bacterium]|nr:tetratricopeptide repeat protein [Bacteroidales bacterium]